MHLTILRIIISKMKGQKWGEYVTRTVPAVHCTLLTSYTSCCVLLALAVEFHSSSGSDEFISHKLVL